MLTLTLKKKTKSDGHLVLDAPTTLIDKNVEIVITIQEQKDILPQPGSEKKAGKFDFSHLYQRLQWKGDALKGTEKNQVGMGLRLFPDTNDIISFGYSSCPRTTPGSFMAGF